MKKELGLFIFLCLSICSQAQMPESSRMDFLLRTLRDGGKTDYVMIFAHRGDWRYAPENSIHAFQRCIDEGIDGIEVDVQKTKDGELVVMHDETLDRTTTGTGKVSDYTLWELKNLYLKSPIGVTTRQRIPTFGEVLELAKGKVLVQVDKWPSVKEQVIEVARRHGCLKQIILRSSLSSEQLKKKYGEFPEEIIYIPVLVSKNKAADEKKVADFVSHISTPVLAFSFKKDDCAILDRIPELKAHGYRIWFNSLWAVFNGGHDDEMAESDEENSYGWLLSKGANIIFCDRPIQLRDYLKNKGHR
ncbi:glycerophosphodiester phosphodiesterase family protein [Bacteroides finegoldii]|uniref:glycerophosphodiester phosphodiesterase family protein n=1 Tax=Bacteroides finegoldii TaxID=338188 RepID=UPI00189CE903|nr:glycerophosphodiester phosphodiesterase family protein [Bacteroides finegoldii]